MSDDLLLENMARDIRELRGEMREVRDALAERRGERRVEGWIGGAIAGILGSIAVALTRAWLGFHS